MSFKNLKKALLACAASAVLMGSGTEAFAAVTIERDQHGVPKITADTNNEMWMAFGYVQARDRIIQMDILRQTSLGILPKLSRSDFLDGKALAAQNDTREIRNIKVSHKYNNLKHELEIELAKIKHTKDYAVLSCFAEGINAFRNLIAGKEPSRNTSCGVTEAELYDLEPHKLSREEFEKIRQYDHELELGFDAEPWTAVEVASLFHLQVMDEFSNRNTEMNNLQHLVDLTKVFSRGEPTPEADVKAAMMFNTIKWAQDKDAATTIPATGILKANASAKAKEYHAKLTKNVNSAEGNFNGCKVYQPDVFRRKIEADLKYAMHQKTDSFPYHASNWWVVSQASMALEKRNQATGVMFNGPQITATDPSKTYQVALISKEGFQFAGNSYPGTINFWQGYNGDLSFGLTAGNIDVSDIFCVDLKSDEQDIYYETASGEKKTLLKSALNPKLWHTKDTNWPVVAIDYNPDRSEIIGTAYIQRYNWQGATVSSLVNWLHAVNARDIDSWHRKLDRVGGNFNLVALDASGKASYRLTGSFPIKHGMEYPASENAQVWDYYPSYDPRLPAPIAPDDGWVNMGDFYHSLRFDMKDGHMANWNQKPFINMPDGDLDYDSYFRFDRVQLIKNELAAQSDTPWTVDKMLNFNGRLQRLDVNYFAFKPFLKRLVNIVRDAELPEVQKVTLLQALFHINGWNGMRGDNTNPELDAMGAEYGHVLFFEWIDALTQNFANRIANGDPNLSKFLMAKLLKTKQPYFPRPDKTKDGIPEQRKTFLTSHGIHINSRIILNALHSTFVIPESEIAVGGVDDGQPLYEYDQFQANLGQNAAVEDMIGALIDAVAATSKYPGYSDAQFALAAPQRLGKGIISRSGISNTIAAGDVQVGFRPKLPSVNHFRNRGALNIIVGFVNGVGDARNITQPGVREYRGFNGEPAIHIDQLKLFSDNHYRHMYRLLPHQNIKIRSKL
ncbi:hypothetical protein GUA87_11680 [Sneathiella sp. P13V-1]|uniref:penicillin acylase family protein n=1 Tax=Sneathiella sp. P13V-1 TaxID=2697366 RepID=UPI00187B9E4D|nr:penicillin acylase family protein [Sneathiella sp. P13V-1]MBE7637507.1 hypothetical protein [Sneathiella sp. P13V-1]